MWPDIDNDLDPFIAFQELSGNAGYFQVRHNISCQEISDFIF